jgi:hypothetical protein
MVHLLVVTFRKFWKDLNKERSYHVFQWERLSLTERMFAEKLNAFKSALAFWQGCCSMVD